MSGIVGSAGSKSGVIGETEIDYEEGTWTATASSGGSIATAATVMTYIKIGKLVTLQGQFQQGTSQASGNLQLINLPFANVSNPTNGNALAIGALRVYNQALATGYSNAGSLVNIEANATTMEFYNNTDNAAVTNIGRDDAAYEAFSITYRTN